MKKMDSQYNKLNAMMENIKDVISDLKEKANGIEQKVWDEDRGMTNREQKKCDEIDEQISNLDECVEYIQFAMMRLEEYTD